MMTRFSILLALAVGLAAACARADDEPAPALPPPAASNQDDTSVALPSIRLSRAFPRLSFQRPVLIANTGDDRLFVLEQKGRIRVFANRSDVEKSDVFLDLRPKVHTGHNEEGLLGLAFDPDYVDNRHFYVYYSASGPRRGRELVGRAVTGGHVYRGQAAPGLVGAYIYGDYVTGRIWALRYDGAG